MIQKLDVNHLKNIAQTSTLIFCPLTFDVNRVLELLQVVMLVDRKFRR